MLILNLVDTAAIRAVVGVTEDLEELPDSYFQDLGIASLLALELNSWVPSPIATIITNGEAAVEYDDSWTALEALKNAAKFYCAWLVLQSRDISLFQRLEDGNNRLVRAAGDLDRLLESTNALYNKFKDLVILSLGSDNTAGTTWIMGSASPSYDPVTDTTT